MCGYRPVLCYSKVNISESERFVKPGMGIMVIFQSNLTIFCKASPHFGQKWTSFVAILAQNTCLCGCRLILYQFKFNISLLSRFMKPTIGIIDEFLLQPHHFLSNKSPFRRKMNYFVAILAQNTCVCGYRPVLYYSKVNISLLGGFVKHVMAIMDTFILQPHNFLPSQSPC